MSTNHRKTEKLTIYNELRMQSQRLGEMAASVQLALKQMQLWGGPIADDFGDETDPDALAMLNETIIALEGAAVVMNSLNTPCPNYPNITAGDAILRIARRG